MSNKPSANSAGRVIPETPAEYHAAHFPHSAAVDPRLLAEGWKPRFATDSERAEEAVEIYRQLGFEIRRERIPTQAFADVCRACALAAACSYVMIYTRSR
ncbi:MAG: hypothetical protein HYZ26_11440 [Chloroflexi bacterium]|nr:hypothetical protein [Chloroflexota bacterium]